ncbi:Helix-turn-helix domain-containing protein [Amycolatopsis tolypomycina]|uniref:Helix-turn-helix domain-containing protein n=1 Tax=Amycolatopsis tolypomycina TaxID=208445 RepID=A0A1H4Q4N5_9PSEU|nr:helix-turn-helix transcriptional regulator [Amycolatopsis tolypomycina]SEC14490.1 Helix-turn-helix domain-containing protein [Amycolatopsis tolypomycina]
MTGSFGAHLRRTREQSGMSLGALATKINYSKSYLSKIENDLKPPTPDIARRCDAVFGTAGLLSSLVGQSEAEPGAESREDGFDASPELPLAGRAAHPAAIDEPVLEGLRAAFDQFRHLGTISTPGAVLGPVVAQLHVLRAAAHGQPEQVRRQVLLLASRAAEYVGWMSQEAGDEAAALWWTHRAVAIAEEAEDRHFAGYALVRQAEIAMYRQDPLTTIDLAMQAQAVRSAGTRIRGLAARCEAQGRALVGDADGYHRALERATNLLAERDPVVAGTPHLGSASVADEIALSHGWSLYDLGRQAEAAEVLDAHVTGIAAGARRARARFGARRVLAHAGSGEIEHALALAPAVLEDARYVDSATIRTDLRELAKVFARWHGHPGVRELRLELATLLRLKPRYTP